MSTPVPSRQQLEPAAHECGECRRLAAELEDARQDLLSLTHFVSHDLRAPLRAVDGFARILEEDHGEALDDEAQRVIGVIRDRALLMGRLIDDLLRFSRLAHQTMHVGRVNMPVLLETVLQHFAGRAERQGATLRAKRLEDAEGDVGLLRDVFANLIDNALGFGEGKQGLLVEVGGERRDDELVYYVRDNGPGFDMAYAEKIFEVFQRLLAAPEPGGTGMGLAVAQRIVRRHGGRMWAESQPGQGATFYFTLPIPRPSLS